MKVQSTRVEWKSSADSQYQNSGHKSQESPLTTHASNKSTGSKSKCEKRIKLTGDIGESVSRLNDDLLKTIQFGDQKTSNILQHASSNSQNANMSGDVHSEVGAWQEERFLNNENFRAIGEIPKDHKRREDQSDRRNEQSECALKPSAHADSELQVGQGSQPEEDMIAAALKDVWSAGLSLAAGPDGFFEVLSLVPDGPAQREGITQGDLVFEADSKELRGIDLDQVL